MDRFFIKFAPYIITISVLVLHVIGYLLTVNLGKQHYFLIWSSIALIDMAFAFRCGKLIQRLHKGVYEDALTKVNNRGFFYLKMNEELEKLKKKKSVVSLIMIDMDNFKIINDTYGHVIGDKLVTQLANVLSHNIRKGDSIIRWGGDEFAIILPETSQEYAYNTAERIRQIIEEYMFCFNSIVIKITISIGIASIKEELSIDTFVDLADCALYKAKQIKNTVINLNNS